jgi:predicted membrane-bound mannosyltransferase
MDNGVKGRMYTKQAKGDVTEKLFELAMREDVVKTIFDKRAKALEAARSHLLHETTELKKKIASANEILSKTNADQNQTDLGLATVAALATVTGVVAAIVAAPVVATGAAVVVVGVGVAGIVNDALRPEKEHSTAEEVREGASKTEVGLDAAHAGEEIAHKEFLGEIEFASKTAGKVASTGLAAVSGGLTTYERYEAAQTEAYQLPDVDADGSVSKFEKALDDHEPTYLQEKEGFTEETREELKDQIKEAREAQAKYQRALKEYKNGLRIYRIATATYVDAVKKALGDK